MSDSIELTQNSKYANKRTREEIEQHRIFIVEKLQQGFAHAKIAEMLEEETGISLSRSQISYDIKVVRENWRTQQLDTYEAYINEELAWLDMYERTLWQEYRKSAGAQKKERIEEVMESAMEEGDPELAISRVVTYIEENNAGDPKILDMILRTRQDRRKILGLYAPSKAIIRTEHVQTEKVKGFVEVSPDDWDVVDGEYSVN